MARDASLSDRPAVASASRKRRRGASRPEEGAFERRTRVPGFSPECCTPECCTPVFRSPSCCLEVSADAGADDRSAALFSACQYRGFGQPLGETDRASGAGDCCDAAARIAMVAAICVSGILDIQLLCWFAVRVALSWCAWRQSAPHHKGQQPDRRWPDHRQRVRQPHKLPRQSRWHAG